jgi:hypothetical protein
MDTTSCPSCQRSVSAPAGLLALVLACSPEPPSEREPPAAAPPVTNPCAAQLAKRSREAEDSGGKKIGEKRGRQGGVNFIEVEHIVLSSEGTHLVRRKLSWHDGDTVCSDSVIGGF